MGTTTINLASAQANAQANMETSTPAVSASHVYGVYHQFYNHPYNIVGMEYLAKFIYPEQFKDLDPAKTYHDIVRNFTNLPDQDFILGWTPKK